MRQDTAMSEIGDLLELLHAADVTFGTIRARYRLWRHHERLSAAFLADAGRSGGTVAQAVGRERAPAESEEIVSIWRQPPDSARVERGDDESSRSYGVRHGELWWSWDPTVGAMSNAENRSVGSGIGEEFATLLHPHVLVAALHLTPVERAVRAEREVIVAEATPRGNPTRGLNVGLALLEIGRGADRFRLEFDAERGIVLASHAFTDGEPFSTIEAVEVAYDEQLDESLFEFVAPPGEQVQSAGGVHRIRRHLSVAEAQAAAPFRILIPEQVPRGWHMHCSYFDGGSRRPQSPPLVAITYRSDAADEGLTISESLAAHEHPLAHTSGWRDATAGQHRVRVRDRDESFGQAQLIIEREGTHILMTSETLTVADLTAFTRLLRPATAN